MINASWSELFAGFKMYYPSLADKVIKIEQKSDYVIFVTLSDGTIIEYNDLMNSIRTVQPYDESEDGWEREFAHRLLELMVEKDFDQSHLSEVSGVSQQSISNYMHRKTMPTGFVIKKLAKALQCAVSDLINF